MILQEHRETIRLSVAEALERLSSDEGLADPGAMLDSFSVELRDLLTKGNAQDIRDALAAEGRGRNYFMVKMRFGPPA